MNWLSDATLRHLCNVADQPDLTGTRYELVEQIGHGGMGTVYRARDRELDRDVALKVLNGVALDPAAQARMVAEARITARLEHPGIVPVHDAGVLPDGRFFYAMKLVRGKRLNDQMDRTTALSERLHLFQKVCDAVAFSHSHGIVHRDLKPQNIMVGPFGEVLVLDWGVATELDARPRPAAVPATVVGTPGYMAPEQADGNADERADVFALGGVLYFLLAGRPPAYEPATGVVPASVLKLPRRFDRSVPRPLEAICRKALAFSPAERYANVPELAADVGAFLDRRRVRAYPEGFLGAALRLGTTYRTVLTLIVAYLLMRVVLLVFFRT